MGTSVASLLLTSVLLFGRYNKQLLACGNRMWEQNGLFSHHPPGIQFANCTLRELLPILNVSFLFIYSSVCRKQLDEYKEVYFIFDRYYDHPIKGEERLSRAKGLTRTFVLQPGAVMPAQKTMMAVIKNKVQLIDLIVNSLKEKPILSKSLLMLTGSEKTPYKIQDGLVSLFPSLNTTHEEADIIIVNQLLWAVKEKPTAGVMVICEDTDVFILLVHYYSKEEMKCQLYMKGPSIDRKLINIKKTVLSTRTNHNIDPELLLPLHALSGCDTVASCSGIGKNKALKALQNDDSPNLGMLGNLSSNFEELYIMAVQFISQCYGTKPDSDDSSMTPSRIKLWYRKVSSATSANPALQRLPPTDSSFRANVRRAHYQAALWRSCSSPDPPDHSPEDFGWHVKLGLMLPKLFDGTPAIAPESLLALIKCQCQAETRRCNRGSCSCKKANMPCTKFCRCGDDGTRCERFQEVEREDQYEDIGLSDEDD